MIPAKPSPTVKIASAIALFLILLFVFNQAFAISKRETLWNMAQAMQDAPGYIPYSQGNHCVTVNNDDDVTVTTTCQRMNSVPTVLPGAVFICNPAAGQLICKFKSVDPLNLLDDGVPYPLVHPDSENLCVPADDETESDNSGDPCSHFPEQMEALPAPIIPHTDDIYF